MQVLGYIYFLTFVVSRSLFGNPEGAPKAAEYIPQISFVFYSFTVGVLFYSTLVLHGTATDPLENNPRASRPFIPSNMK